MKDLVMLAEAVIWQIIQIGMLGLAFVLGIILWLRVSQRGKSWLKAFERGKLWRIRGDWKVSSSTEEKSPFLKFDDNPISKGDTKMDGENGIAELIWQQEQTNKHLQKLISDFFWFRVGGVVLLLIGGIFSGILAIAAIGGFN